jgi:hypothetical protein
VIVAMGTRSVGEGVYPVAAVAVKHGAGVERETTSPDEAYAHFEKDVATPYREGWLPELNR